jgi:hypothetical protein
MATVRHSKVSGVPNPADPTLVGGEDWDDDHDVTLVDADIPASIARDSEVTAAIAALSTVYQPLDSDLTAVAALTTTAYGRALLELANQAALLSAAGAAAASHAHAGEDVTSGTVADARIASTIARDSEVTAAIAALSTVYQPLDSDLTSIAALTTTAFGRGLLALADAAALRSAAGLVIGTDVPAFGSTVMDGDAAGGDLGGTYPNPTVTDDSHSHTSATLPAAGADLSGVDFLVGTASGLLSAEIPVGTSPGGELGGTWASPTVDATHSGSAHHDAVTVGTGLDVTGQLVELDLSEVAAGGELGGFMDAPTVDATHSGSTHAATQAAAEGTAASALSGHASDTTSIHGIADTSALLDTADIGVSVQAYSANLDEYAAVNPTAAGLALLDDADAAAQRATLDLEPGTDIPSLSVFNDHSARHENGGGDEISVAGLNGIPADVATAGIQFVIDGGGSTITTGVKGYVEVPFACTITAVRLLADQSGAIVVDIWNDTYANYPPTDADSITASAPPTISSSGVKSEDTTLTGWDPNVAAGDILGFNVDSVTSHQRVTVALRVTRV